MGATLTSSAKSIYVFRDSFFQVTLLSPLVWMVAFVNPHQQVSLCRYLVIGYFRTVLLSCSVMCMHTFQEINTPLVTCILGTVESEKKWPREQPRKKHDGRRSSASRRKRRDWLMRNNRDKRKRRGSAKSRKSRTNLQSSSTRSAYL